MGGADLIAGPEFCAGIVPRQRVGTAWTSSASSSPSSSRRSASFCRSFGVQFWINVLLTLLGYIPGIIHALWVILRT
jgi:hypothetical protein